MTKPITAVAVGVLLFSSVSWAWETDQYTNRWIEIRDATDVMNVEVNRKIREVIEDWDAGEDRFRFATQIYLKLVGPRLEGKYEIWLNQTADVDRAPMAERNIYVDAPMRGARGNWLFNGSPTVLVNGVRVGTDKPGHFLSEGYVYYRIAYIQGKGEAEALRYGTRSESSYYGWTSSGVYSNADLVANFEGMRFYQSLSGLVRWEQGKPVLQREFDWADHVTAYWDEALNPSKLVSSLQDAVYLKLVELCPEYWREPERFQARGLPLLRRRYAQLGIIDQSANRLDRVCGH